MPRLWLALLSMLLCFTPLVRAEEFITVLVARQDLARGTQIDPDKHFKRVRYIKGEEPKDAVTDPASVKGLVLLVAMAEDQPLKAKFLGKGAAALSTVLPEGHRAFTMKVEPEAAVAGFILPGARVDVIWTVTKDGKTESKIVVQDVLVFAVNVNADKEKPMLVTVAVKPDQVEKLATVTQSGKLSLALRAPDGK